MSAILQDLRLGLRLLIRSPAFTIVAILALAIGIGANTAIFSVINTLLIQRLPYHDADRLVVVWEHNLPRHRKTNVVGPANFLHWREMNHVFEDLAAITFSYSVTVTGNGDPEELQAQSISAELFPILGVQPAMGRGFTAAENVPAALRSSSAIGCGSGASTAIRTSLASRLCRREHPSRSSASCRRDSRSWTGTSTSGCRSDSQRNRARRADDRSPLSAASSLA